MSFGRLFFTVVGIVLLVGTGTAWILSSQNVIQNSWSVPLGTGFGFVGVLFAFCQWAIPLPSLEAKPSTASATLEAQESFIKQVYDRLSQGNGAIIIYEKMSHVGENMELEMEIKDEKSSYGYGFDRWKDHSKANIVERMMNGRSLVAAIFPDLEPGCYRVCRWSPYESIEVTVLPRQVAEVDWRGQGEKVKKRLSLFSDLRTGSSVLGVGGLLFLAHRYLMIPSYLSPYLDLASIVLIWWGAGWLGGTLLKTIWS